MHLICCIKKRNYICDMKEKEEYKIGKLLASIRKTMGLSQTEVAEKSHVTRQNISRIELGKYSPGADVIQRIEEALGVERIYITKNNIIMGESLSLILGATDVQELYKVAKVLPCFRLVELSKDKNFVSAIWNDEYEMDYEEPEMELDSILTNLNWCCGDPEEYPLGSKCWWLVEGLEPEL